MQDSARLGRNASNMLVIFKFDIIGEILKYDVMEDITHGACLLGGDIRFDVSSGLASFHLNPIGDVMR